MPKNLQFFFAEKCERKLKTKSARIMINYTFQKKPLPQQIQICKIFAKTKNLQIPL